MLNALKAAFRSAAATTGLLVALLAMPSPPTAANAGTQPAAPAQPSAWKEVPLQPGIYSHQTVPHRTDTIEVPVPPNGGEIEYMVGMKQGDTIVYSWRALEISEPAKLTSEFHGHTERASGTTGTLVFYRKAAGATESGSLAAPFAGTHGWYLKNDTASPVVVRLNLAGFYEVLQH